MEEPGARPTILLATKQSKAVAAATILVAPFVGGFLGASLCALQYYFAGPGGGLSFINSLPLPWGAGGSFGALFDGLNRFPLFRLNIVFGASLGITTSLTMGLARRGYSRTAARVCRVGAGWVAGILAGILAGMAGYGVLLSIVVAVCFWLPIFWIGLLIYWVRRLYMDANFGWGSLRLQ